MKVRIRLGESDRERYGAPESMEVDIFSVSMVEATIMQAGRDVEGLTISYESPGHWRSALSKGNMGAILTLVWLGLRRAELKDDRRVSYGEIDFDTDAFDYDIVPDQEEPNEEVGKDTSDPVTTS